MATRALLAAALLMLGGCEDDPRQVDSPTVEITVNSINESDIDPPGQVEKDENISNESGNPWGEFIKAARRVCGEDPSDFTVTSVTVSLVVEESQDVFALEDVFTGPLEVFFAGTPGSDEEATRVTVASTASVAGRGAGPVTLTGLAGRSDLRVLLDRLNGGDFHVGVHGVTDRTGDDPFSANVRIRLRARAYCE